MVFRFSSNLVKSVKYLLKYSAAKELSQAARFSSKYVFQKVRGGGDPLIRRENLEIAGRAGMKDSNPD